MSSPAPKPKPSPSPKTPSGPSPSAAKSGLQSTRSQAISRGVRQAAQKIIIYGPGGVGKTKLASLTEEIGVQPLFIDIEEGSNFLDVPRIDPTPETFEELLAAIRDYGMASDCHAIVIDSLTKAEELAIQYTLRTVPHEKGHFVESVEAYGFGKGYTHVFESFLKLLQALDAAARKGKHIIGICHDCTANVPNPAGEDWIRWEPRLQSPPSGKGSIRHRVKEWCDHLLFVGFDTFVSEGGKASGSGTRTIYSTELPTHWAKSRSLTEPVVYEDGVPTIWNKIFGKE